VNTAGFRGVLLMKWWPSVIVVRVCVMVLLVIFEADYCVAQRSAQKERVARLLWQDHETGRLMWGEVFQVGCRGPGGGVVADVS
jgi:ribosomal protein L35AE/L33A